MRLLLKIKNGTPPQRKTALRQITDKARELGAGPLFNQILPLLMSPTLEDQERHLLVKVIDRVLYKLDDLVRPYVHKILVVIEPLLDRQHAGTNLGGHFTSWLKFRRERLTGGGSQAGSSGFGFRLTFSKEVTGPIALGYGCHFGLGSFVAVR